MRSIKFMHIILVDSFDLKAFWSFKNVRQFVNCDSQLINPLYPFVHCPTSQWNIGQNFVYSKWEVEKKRSVWQLSLDCSYSATILWKSSKCLHINMCYYGFLHVFMHKYVIVCVCVCVRALRFLCVLFVYTHATSDIRNILSTYLSER